MHTVPPLLPEGMTEQQHRELVISAIDRALQVRGLTRAALRRIGTFASNAVLRGSDLTRNSIEKILTFANINGAAAKEIWALYVGREPVTVRDHLQAYLRTSSTFADLEKQTGFGVSRIEYYLYGQKRKGSEERIPPKFPDYPFWKVVAPHLGLSEEKAYEIWLTDARKTWTAQRNPLGAEVEVLMQEYGVSGNQWIHGDRPHSLRKYGVSKLQMLLSGLRNGDEHSFSFVKQFCDALNLHKKRRHNLYDAVIETIIQGDPRLNNNPHKSTIRRNLLSKYLRGADLTPVITELIDTLQKFPPPSRSLAAFRSWVQREFSEADADLCDGFSSVYLLAVTTVSRGGDLYRVISTKIDDLRKRFVPRKSLTVHD
jgi:hypothetical protein